MQINSILSSALLGLLAAAPFASAHSWVEQMMAIAPNGTLVGQPGYARGNYMRSTPGFGDPTMVNLLPPDGRTINQLLPSDLMCKSTQTSQTQTNGSPRLQAAAGDGVALRYQENGHVTLPDNQPGKPQNRGTVYVYGTSKPSADDSFLAIHRVWTADGTGGDGRGRLLSTRNFDDGQCYQTNGGQISQQRQQQFKHAFDMTMGNDLWCQQDIQLPTDLATGQPYTLYWIWDWPTLPGTAGFPDGKQEIYTTCMDIDVVGDTGIVPVSESQVSYAQGQPFDFAAVADQVSDLGNPTAVTGSTIAFSASATGPASGGASEASVSAAAATSTGVPDFLSVHTGSTAGPGIETQTFTVLPISVTSTDSSQPTGGFGGNGRGSNNGAQVTGAPNAVGNAQVTLTEYESITQTMQTTVYVTQYTKRDAGESDSPSSTPTSTPRILQPSQWHYFNSSRPHGPPPWATGAWTSGRPSGPPPWVTGAHASGRPWASGRPDGPPPWMTGDWSPRNGSRKQNSSGTDDDGNNGNTFGATTTAQTTITVQGTTTLTIYLPSNAVVPVTLTTSSTPAAADTQSTVTVAAMTVTSTSILPSATPPSPIAAAAVAVSNHTAESFSSTSTVTVFMTITPSSLSTFSTLPSPPLPSSFTPTASSSPPSVTHSLTIHPIPDPLPTQAPASTDHAAFRLRARNPFVMLGWMAETKTTSS